MTQTSLMWDGTTTGDATAAPYDFATEVALVLDALCGALGVAGVGGVARGARSQYGATIGSNQVTIAAGTGVAYGTVHDSDANVVFTVATPSGSTRVDRIVLRKSWSAQTVRLVQIAGVEGGGAPALVQSAGVTWDTPLWRASITTGAVITLTDDRVMLPVHGDQSAETGTKHAFSNLSGAPAGEVTVADLTPGVAGVAGSSSNYSKGDHAHGIQVAVSDVMVADSLVSNGGTDTPLTVALPAAGSYKFDAILAVQAVTTAEGIQVAIGYAGTTTRVMYGALGLDPTDPTLVGSSVATALNSGLAFGVLTGATLLHIVGYIVVTDADNLSLTFVQNVPDVSNYTAVLSGSSLVAICAS